MDLVGQTLAPLPEYWWNGCLSMAAANDPYLRLPFNEVPAQAFPR
jgi:hypothetical protein